MKFLPKIVPLWLCLCLLAGCGEHPPTEEAPPEAPETPEAEAYLSCRIVDGAETGSLLLAELDAPLDSAHGGLADGRGVYHLSVTEDTPVFLDGQPAGPDALRDGMPVEIAFNGEIQESYPAGLGQIQALSAWSPGTEQSPGGIFYDLSGLYLQVLEDLWAEDSGLNESGVEMVSVDLSQAPGGLLESERQAIAWRFGELHGAEPLTASYEELVDQGHITGEPLEGGGGEFMEWKDGVLFSITANEDHEGETYSLPALFFNAGKWRSSLGAYWFRDCTCVWPELGTWESYQIGSQYIS